MYIICGDHNSQLTALYKKDENLMSGLFFISEYGDDEDSQSDENDIDDLKLQKIKLPTPNLSKVVVVSAEEYIDNPNLHGGRSRSFPHVRGNWATFVYIEYPLKNNLSKIINQLSNLVASIDLSCDRCEDIHLSLSKTFTLKYHMIEPLSSALQEILGDIESFELGFDAIEVYCNEEKTRTFIALKVNYYSNKLLTNVTNKINGVLDDYRLPTFYDDPSFHMSILSVIGDKKEEILNILEDLNRTLISEEDIVLETITIEKVFCKTGNKIFQYHLSEKYGA